MTFDQIIGDIRKKVYAPVYFLHGDETFYIDAIAEALEKQVLNESEREFNQTVLYGKDTDLLTLISTAKRYPMMASYQVVIVKEAQDIRNLISKAEGKDSRDPLIEYIQKPTPTTILVFCYKYKTLDKRTRLFKALQSGCVVFESKKLYDNQIPDWITRHILSKGFRTNPKATQLMAEYLGTDLSRIANEVDKLVLNLKPGDEITATMVEENIGISKEFNVFELQSALGKRNIFKANQIVQYFGRNPKNNPLVLTIPSIFTFFMKLLTYHSLTDRSRNAVAAALGINPYFVTEYETAAKAYPYPLVIRNISYLRDYDLRSKGVRNDSTGDDELLKELVYKLLH
jgi:DNA polymerase-3 subunit delta